ncbi:exonuclease V [Citrus sinensis]|nr:exonuclease V [Citrus sinensis]
MSGSHADSTQSQDVNSANVTPDIPIEIVSEEEMALIDAALAAPRCCSPSSSLSFASQLQRNARFIHFISFLSKRSFSGRTESDIEDLGHLGMTQKRNIIAKSLLDRFRKNRALSVTDVTDTVTKKVKVRVRSTEDIWAVKLFNSITGVNQLLFEGLTRELPMTLVYGPIVAYNIRLGFIKGVWMVGVIDEIQMPVKETARNPILVDTKTRAQYTLPAESQKRNGRLQLMCYKYMWDNLAADNFPSMQFYDFFSLNSDCILSEEIIEKTSNAGFPAKTLGDLVKYFRNMWNMLPASHNQLLLRYEFQKDQSLLGEEKFAYDYDLFNSQIEVCLEFWKGEREASFTPLEDRWKCRYCQFESVCPAVLKPEITPIPSQTDCNNTPS